MSALRLSPARLAAFNRAVYSLYTEADRVSPIETVIELLSRLVPHVWISVDEVRADGTMVHHGGRNCEVWPSDMGEALTRVGHTSPVIAAGFVPAIKLSDLCTLRQFRQTGYYGEFMAGIPSFRDQAALVVQLPSGRLGFCMSHERYFTAEDLLVLELLQPHVEHIISRIAEHFPLPADPPLTPREREVLHWLAEGKRDAEIGLILEASERTIKQHVRGILRKLGAETRTTAAAIAWRTRVQRGGKLEI